MFVAVPTGHREPLRVAPLASVLLVLLNVAAAGWVLPQSDRLGWERQLVRRELAPPRPPAVDGAAADLGRRDTARRAALTARLAVLEAADPFETWGYRLGAAPWRAVSALFVHADALHLGANILFLALVGAQLEQVWGPAGLLGLFLAAGALALHVDACSAPTALVVGASGGVAALLGAYCVRFRRARLRWVYVHLVYLRPQVGRFEMPCLGLGAVWLAQQTVGLWLARRAGDDSIAFVSHLCGFGLGMLAAVLVETGAGAVRRAAPPRLAPGPWR
jgi:membrane associated rhomboid family serine protease